jgi:phenylpropionate dioxygenase-like ring-hydroxylating dioxygenase large terminal subunit
MNILEPSLYAKTRLPLAQAETLPAWCYTSQEFYDEEVKNIFRKTWNFVGRVDEIPAAGDYFTVDLFGDSVIVVRDRTNKVRAFANTCRHRGTRLVDGKGKCRTFTCPYHSWAFSLSGELIGAPGMEGVAGFDMANYPLFPVRLDTWGGFMFVNLDSSARPLSDYLGNAVEAFASYNFDDMVVVRKKEFDLACNWKIYIENAMEDYHTATVHRVSIGTQVCSRAESVGNWDAIHMPQETSVAVLPGETTSFPHIPTLKGKPAEGTYFAVVYPNWFFATTQDCMWWLYVQPRGPNRSIVMQGAVFPRATTERPDFAETVEKYYKRWDKSLPEDNEISVLQQAGLKSSFSQPGRFSLNEPVVHSIAQWVLDRVVGAGSAVNGNGRARG